jgi:hypothetical protein
MATERQPLASYLKLGGPNPPLTLTTLLFRASSHTRGLVPAHGRGTMKIARETTMDQMFRAHVRAFLFAQQIG